MSTLSIKATTNTISSRDILIHSLFFIPGLGYMFYFFPDWYTNRFHIFAPFILAVIDVLAFYIFFTLISVLKRSRLLVIPLLFLLAGLYLYYSSAVNSARMMSAVFKLAEVPLFFSKVWVLATLPRLFLVLGTALLYFALLNRIRIKRDLKRYISLELICIAITTLAFLILKQPPVSDRDFIEVLVIKILVIGLFYISAFVLSPLLFKQKKYLKFIGFILLSYLVTLVSLLASTYFHDNSNRIPDLEVLLNFLGKSSIAFLFFVVFGLAYGGVRHLIVSRFQKTKRALGKSTSELLLLKSQVNPHFLFNTLNTLYATALEEEATITASATAKLANLVRYMQQDMQQEFIPLEREAGYVSDYINIQKLRIASPLEINTGFEDLDGVQISPGLLIPFVENAFKYGVDPDKISRIEISIKVEKQQIQFCCKNTYNPDQTTYYREKGFGIGIQNTRERLELIYPNRYDLKIDKNQNRFEVKLKINIL